MMLKFYFCCLLSSILKGVAQETHSKNTPEFNKLVDRKSVIEFFNNVTFSTFTKNKDAVANKFVCLNPTAKFYGGWGNVVFYAFTLMEIGIGLDRIPVMNHALMTTLFQHPDDRQVWALLSFADIDRLKNEIEGIPRCNGINERTVESFPPKFGLHGCPGNYNNNHAILGRVKSLLSGSFPIYADLDSWGVNVLLMQWVFSKPSLPWLSAVNSYRKTVFGDENMVADLAIQIRTWRDLGEAKTFEGSNGPCILFCTTKALDVLSKFIKREFRIFVTADDAAVAQKFIELLQQWGVDNSKPVHVYVPGPEQSNWHTVDLTNQGRYSLDISQVEHNVALLDWMILSEAHHSVYTLNSGFSSWARMRGGFQNQSCDVVAGNNEENKCVCVPVLPDHCESYLQSLHY